MKKGILLLSIMVALAGEASLVYRGRLVTNSRPNAATTFSGEVTRDMTFRIYDSDGNFCAIERKGVRVAANGTFSVVLDSDELTTMLTNGTAASVGLSIGEAPEIQPRRELLSLARANHATIADGLARDARVGTLAANELVCDRLTAKGRVSAKTITGADGGRLKNVACRMPAVGMGQTLELVRGGSLSVFGACQRLTLKNGASTMTVKQGSETIQLCTAPANGVATIRCVTTHGVLDYAQLFFTSVFLVDDYPGFSIVRFCQKGEAINVPSQSEWLWTSDASITEGAFEVDFHPFIADVTGK